MPEFTVEDFLRANTPRRLEIVRDDIHSGLLQNYLGKEGYDEYRKLAKKLDTSHLSPKARKNLIFVPGVMGSLLQSKSRGGIWWIDMRTRARIDQLGLSADGTEDANPDDEIIPATSDPSYDPFLTAVLGADGFGHEIFAYDWRKSLTLSAAALRDLVLRLHNTNGGKPVHLVAHSMGGLMVRAALMSHGTELWPKLGRIVFIATPHYGAPAIAGYLKNHFWGFDLMAVLGQYLSRPTFRSLWGVLAMLPAPRGVYPGTRPNDAASWRSDDAEDAYVHPCANFDMYQAEAWKLDLTASEASRLQRVLNGAVAFHREMDAAHRTLDRTMRSRMMVIAGVGYKTLFRLAYETRFLGSWERAAKITARIPGDPCREGDGRVPLAAATLESVPIRYVKGVHGGLPNIPAVYKNVFRFLREEPMDLPTTVKAALSAHLGAGARSDAPNLDGTVNSTAFTDDPGLWMSDPVAPERLAELTSLLEEGRLPEFARLRLL